MVSIIVLCHNRWRDTRRCLESLKRSTDSSLYELLVYDNASTDGTWRGLRRLARGWPQLRLFQNEGNLRFSRAVNRGMRRSRGRYFLWLNNDTVLAPGWLEGLLAAARSDERVAAVGPMTNRMAPPAQISKAFSNGRGSGAVETPFLGGFCLLLKREAAEAAGILDERFVWGWEDMDYCLRLRQAGGILLAAKDVFVRHAGSRTIGRMAALLRRSTDKANRGLILRKWLHREPFRGDLRGLLKRTPTLWELRPSDRALVSRHWSKTAWPGTNFQERYWGFEEIPPRVSIIAPCRGGWPGARRSLESVRRSAGPTTYEVLAAGIGKRQGRQDGLRRLSRDWPELKVLGPWDDIPLAHALNLAIKEALGDCFLILGDDITASSGWIEGLLGAAKSAPNVGMVAPAARGGAGRPRAIRHVGDHCLLISRAVFAKVGEFDERFEGSFAARDYCLRVWQAGYQVLEAPGAPVLRRHAREAGAQRDGRRLFEKWAGHALFRP